MYNNKNTFIQQGCVNLNKSDSKDIYNVTKHFCLKKKHKKMYHGVHKNIGNNKKCYLSTKSAYYSDF